MRTSFLLSIALAIVATAQAKTYKVGIYTTASCSVEDGVYFYEERFEDNSCHLAPSGTFAAFGISGSVWLGLKTIGDTILFGVTWDVWPVYYPTISDCQSGLNDATLYNTPSTDYITYEIYQVPVDLGTCYMRTNFLSMPFWVKIEASPMPVGALIGIIVGSIVGFCVLVGVIWYCCCRKTTPPPAGGDDCCSPAGGDDCCCRKTTPPPAGGAVVMVQQPGVVVAAPGVAAPASVVVAVNEEPPKGAKFDANTGAPIPKFDPDTGKQNW